MGVRDSYPRRSYQVARGTGEAVGASPVIRRQVVMVTQMYRVHAARVRALYSAYQRHAG